MHKSFLKPFVLAVVTALAVSLTPSALAQVVTSGLAGTVRSNDGSPISGATVTTVFTPTNATFTSTTSASGRYQFGGLPVGGPYTITTSAAGFTSEPVTDIHTELGNTIDVNLSMKSDVLKLEKFVATGTRNELDSSSAGATTLLTSARLAAKPTTQRSLADLVSTTPGITLRALSGDREEAMITAVGQNNRYNKWMIDGNLINDQFGLNSTGLASFFNPLALDTIEQLSVQISPYDTRYSGFTGATINAVTKSGTNEFHGSAYYIFSGDHLFGLQMQGPDARTLVQFGVKVVPKLERTTKGLTFGGPLWKDHLFFFLNWEKFNRIGAPSSAGLPGVSAADLATIDARVAAITKVNYGHLGGNANSVANDEKKQLKLDWQINRNHRLSTRYTTTEGQVPQFGSFTTTSFGSGLNNNGAFANLVGGAATSYDSHFYAQTRKEKTLSAQLFSQWSSDLKTELKWSHVKQDQYTPVAVIAPEIDIFGVTGTNQGGATITNGVVVLGTERFRHGNQINADTKNYSAIADYTRGNATLSAGFDMEDNNYYNLFRQFSYGVFNFATPADFAADNPRFFQRNFTDLALKGSYADVSQYTQTGVFLQGKWESTSRLKFLLGIRYDKSSSSTVPAFNQQFLTDTGMRNDGTIDGAHEFSPRFSFNWALDEARNTQIRGGVGYFVGRSPWVFFSNSYGNTGAGTFSSLTLPAGGLTGYLASSFDPANPNGTATQTGTSRAEIDLTDAGIHLPSIWRGNLSLDHKLYFLDSSLTLDLTYSKNDHTMFITNDNLQIKGVAADGRVYFVGNPSAAANAKYANYTNIFHTSNANRVGEQTYITVQWDRPMKNHWAFNLSYTRGKSTEAQANGQTTASGAWQRNAVFNQSTVEVGRSDFEVKDRVQVSLTRQFEFIKTLPTTASLYYEGRTGSPYSFAYNSDLNQDGFAGNDLVAIPTGASDARFDFSGMTPAAVDAMMASIGTLGLSKYAGSYAPKNAFYQPWVNKLDLVVRQTIPLHYKKSKLDLELAFTNFGSFISKSLFNYTERAPSTVNDVFDRRLVGNATIDNTTGKIKPTTWAPAAFLVDNTMSRWRIQLTARLSF
jgi:outer membrane receptor protein involved in Fe transport